MTTYPATYPHPAGERDAEIARADMRRLARSQYLGYLHFASGAWHERSRPRQDRDARHELWCSEIADQYREIARDLAHGARRVW